MSSIPTRCQCRRKAVTTLRCARCSVPICPDCSRVAPAGMLCRECSSGKWSPLFQVSVGSLTQAYAACLAVGILGGWLLLHMLGGFGFFRLWGALLYGLAVAEVALRVTGRKRGSQMEILAGVCAGVGLAGGWLISGLFYGSAFTLDWWLSFLQNPWHYLLAGVAVVAAVGRVRNL